MTLFGADERNVWRIAADKSVGCEEGRAVDCLGMEFLHDYHERITVHQIPCIALKFSLNIGDQARRSIEP